MSFGWLKRRFIDSPRRVDIEDTAYRIVKLVNFYDLLINWVTQHARAWLSTWRIPHALEIYLLSPQGVLVIFNLHIYYYYFLERKYWLRATTTATTEPADISSSNPVGSEFLQNDLAAVLKKNKEKRNQQTAAELYRHVFNTLLSPSDMHICRFGSWLSPHSKTSNTSTFLKRN